VREELLVGHVGVLVDPASPDRVEDPLMLLDLGLNPADGIFDGGQLPAHRRRDPGVQAEVHA
jgi:hypothetical protein